MGDSDALGWQVAAEVHRAGWAGRAEGVRVRRAHCDGSIFELHLEPSGFAGVRGGGGIGCGGRRG